MRTTKRAIYLGALAAMLSATAVSAQTLGASLRAIKHLYPDAASSRVGGAAALEMKDLDYAGVRWSKVDFVFDASGHLQRLSMDTSAATYGAVLQLAQLQLNPPVAQGVTQAEEDASPEMQIRVCESDGKVTMTFEPASLIS